ncbi:dehydrogenase [Clostridia bacterium]|nr:dehydrogenase [Clostridia bacterium]
MLKYMLLCNTPFSAERDASLAALIRDNGYEPIIFRDGCAMPEFPWDECVAALGLVPNEFLPRLPRLKWLQMAWAGVDSLRTAEFPNPDVVITNASGGFGPTIAEYMLGAALLIMHNFHTYINVKPLKEYKRIGFSTTFYGGTVVMIGLGDIGGRFAKYAKALGATVYGVRRTVTAPPEGVDEIIPYDKLLGILPNADVVAMCLPATRETEGLFSAAHIQAMKPGSVFINAGRGSTVDEAALIHALEAQNIAGAVIDVTQVEPLPKDSPLWTLDNVVITPHVAGRSDDPTNARLIYEIFEDNIVRFCRGEPLRHVVDLARGY